MATVPERNNRKRPFREVNRNQKTNGVGSSNVPNMSEDLNNSIDSGIFSQEVESRLEGPASLTMEVESSDRRNSSEPGLAKDLSPQMEVESSGSGRNSRLSESASVGRSVLAPMEVRPRAYERNSASSARKRSGPTRLEGRSVDDRCSSSRSAPTSAKKRSFLSRMEAGPSNIGGNSPQPGSSRMEIGPSHNGRDSPQPGPSHETSSVVSRRSQNSASRNQSYAGTILEITLRNFMCHDHLRFELNQNVNFFIGLNGAGKSAILTAICVALGAQATSTDRGQSLKKFIKSGCRSGVATITLVLNNTGDRAYKPEVFGDKITVIRTITEKGGRFQLKSCKGEVISTKRDQLNAMISCFNIQVNNPVTILNQAQARTFIATSDEKKLYQKFLRALQIDEMNVSLHEIKVTWDKIDDIIKKREQEKAVIISDILKLKSDIIKYEESRNCRERRDALQSEFRWAQVRQCQAKLAEHKELLETQDGLITSFEKQLDSADETEAEIKQKINELEDSLYEFRSKAREVEDQRDKAKKEWQDLRNDCKVKDSDLKQMERTFKRQQDDLMQMKQEIANLESKNSDNDEEYLAIQAEKAKLQEKLATLTAAIKETDQTDSQLRSEHHRLTNDLSRCTGSINGLTQEHRNLNHELANLGSSSLNVYGSYMQRLIDRIEQEFRRGRFTKHPVGPIGKYVKVNSELGAKWVPAIEFVLGYKILQSFIVDNERDANILKEIMYEMCENNRPVIHTNKFTNRVHNVSQYEVRLPGYKNMLQALEISDVNVSNILIDLLRIESVLLINTLDDITGLLEDDRLVPKNAYGNRCVRAVSIFGDSVYPAPNFKMYDGLDPRKSHRSRLLQVSVEEARLTIEKSILEVEQKIAAKHSEQLAFNAQRQEIASQLRSLVTVRNDKRKERSAVEEMLRHLAEEDNANNQEYHLRILKDEVAEMETKLAEIQTEITALKDEFARARENMNAAKTEYENCQQNINNQNEVDVEAEIDSKKDELKDIAINKKDLSKRLDETKKKVGLIQKDIVALEKKEEELTAETVKLHPNVPENVRNVKEVEAELKKAQVTLESIESEIGASHDELERNLLREQKALKALKSGLVKAKDISDQWFKLVETRKIMFRRFVDVATCDVQSKFQFTFTARVEEGRRGRINIDHVNRKICIEIIPRESAILSDLKSLSGGEKSYCTVAFLMALWFSTDIPFYGMDEFDVYMDGANVDSATALLLLTAQMKRDSQFLFLTPKDMSKKVQPSNELSIFQMHPPERTGRQRAIDES